MNKNLRLLSGFILCSISIVCFAQKKITYKTLETSSNVICDICFTNKGQAIGIADNKSVKFILLNNYELIGDFKDGHKKQILSIDISIDSSLLVSGGKDSTVIIWDIKEKKILQTINCNEIITSVCISPDGKLLAYGGSDKKVTVYDIANNKIISVFTEHSDDITSIAFSPDGQYIASSSGDKSINIYGNGALITTLSGHKDWVRDISFNSDNTKLISCGDDSKIIIWNISDIKNPRIINESKHGFGWLLSIDFNKDNKTYALADFKGNVEIVGQYGVYKTNVRSPINRILFKPTETSYIKIAIATRGKGVLLMDAKNMKSKPW